MSFETVSRTTLLAHTDDDYVRWCMPDNAIAVMDGDSWGVAHQWMTRDRWGGFVCGEDLDGAFWALRAAVADASEELGWCSIPLGTTPPEAMALADRSGQWDLMTATRVSDESPADVALVELDDVACAEEITTFGMGLNPTFEGEPNTGKALFWLGIRGDEGRLLGCIAANRMLSGAPHLAGLVVDPSLRGTGAGRRLLVEASRRAIDACGVCTLGVYHDNVHAIALYRGVGYTTTHAFQSHRLTRVG